jgi:hypothetical protein
MYHILVVKWSKEVKKREIKWLFHTAKEDKKGDFQVLKWLFQAIFSLKK